MDIRKTNTREQSHSLGDQFVGRTFLPTGKRLDVRMCIVNSRPLADNQVISLGMRFVDLSDTAEKVLGFFMMG
jgi:hypothetical protein